MGNHWASKLEGNQLHIISEGHGDNRVNRVEIDTPMLVKSNLYELKFTARWVNGCHLLVAHTWDWSVAKVFQLDVPSNLGTPGKPNSRAINTPSYSPASPDATNPDFRTIRVTNSFTRFDGSMAKVGEPLVKRPFPLDRLAWITYKGPSASLPVSDPVIVALLGSGVPLATIQLVLRAKKH